MGIGRSVLKGVTKFFGKFFSKGGSEVVTKTTVKTSLLDGIGKIRASRITETIIEESGKGAKLARTAGTKFITFSRAAYVAIGAGVIYLLYTGLPEFLHKVTGLPIWLCEILIAAVIVFAILNVIRTLTYRLKRTVMPSGGYRRY